MTISVTCSSCDSRLKANDNAAGRRVRCPKCGAAIAVEAGTASAFATKPVKRPEKAPEEEPTRRKRPVQPEYEELDQEEKEERETPREEQRLKKRKNKKKRLKKKEPAGLPGWLWWAAGIGGFLVLMLIVAGLLIRAGHAEAVLGYAISLAILLPISMVIMIASMFISSALGGGINFGELPDVIVKSIALLLVINVIMLIPIVGRWLALVVWVIGAMTLFDLDFWEARFFVFINWALNFVVKSFLLAIMLSALTHDHGRDHGDDLVPNKPIPGKQDELRDMIDQRGGEWDEDDNDPTAPIVRISMTGKPFSDADCAGLMSLAKLRVLELGSTQITDAGVAQLGAIGSLQALDLSRTKVTDEGLSSLKGLKQLQSLTLTGTKVTDRGVKELQKVLPRLKVMR